MTAHNPTRPVSKGRSCADDEDNRRPMDARYTQETEALFGGIKAPLKPLRQPI